MRRILLVALDHPIERGAIGSGRFGPVLHGAIYRLTNLKLCAIIAKNCNW
jgi:hypothetical protein